MFLSWNPPHPPYDQVPEKYWNVYKGKEIPFRENVPGEWRTNQDYLTKREEYFAAIAGLDENFGRIMELFKRIRTGLRIPWWFCQRITVIVWGPMDFMAKNIWYEESIRIPLYFYDRESNLEAQMYCLPARIICHPSGTVRRSGAGNR